MLPRTSVVLMNMISNNTNNIIILLLSPFFLPFVSFSRPDVTFAVDWALQANCLSIYLSFSLLTRIFFVSCGQTNVQNLLSCKKLLLGNVPVIYSDQTDQLCLIVLCYSCMYMYDSLTCFELRLEL